MRKRWIVGGVLAVLLGVSATGIAVNSEWLGGRWDASRAATDLAAKLQKVDGVKSATAKYDPVGLPNPTLVAHVVFAADASPADWSAATALVRSAASTHALVGTTSTADFRRAGSKTHVTVEPLLFTPAAVAAEIAAWGELRHAVGDRVSLHLGYPADLNVASGPIVREYTVATEADARAVAASWPDHLPALDPSIQSSWSGPGLQMTGMPSKPMMTALNAVGAVLPLGLGTPGPVEWRTPDVKGSGTLAVIFRAFDGFQLIIVSLEGDHLGRATPSAKMAQAAQAAFSAGANGVEWETADGIRALELGDCPSYTAGTRTIQSNLYRNHRDTEFAAQLARLGFVQPPDVRAGMCA